MTVLVTGANGFIGRNLTQRLKEEGVAFDVFTKEQPIQTLKDKVAKSSFIVHLAGVNRPEDESEFEVGNVNFTRLLCDCLVKSNNKAPIIFTSSIQAELDNKYGQSKKQAEIELIKLQANKHNPVLICRLPNVFGKWCRPNYNSVVATFCNNIVNDKSIVVHDPNVELNLVYIDDVIKTFVEVIKAYYENKSLPRNVDVQPVYRTTVGELEKIIRSFAISRKSGVIPKVGSGLLRALYATYISYYNPTQFSYNLQKHEDPRGVFVEMLKTSDSGQFSFFTAHPGVTRGGHYHHTKNEKFLVVKGKARFGFRNILTGEKYSLEVSEKEPVVVETVPGWSHNITNIGNEEMLVLLWANEIFDPENPDTIYHEV